jgi:hypothetical protein
MNTEIMAKEPSRLIVHNEPNPLAGTPAYMLQLAVEQGADLAKLEKLMDLHERWSATEARKAYVAAVAGFRGECPAIDRTAQGHNRKYAGLADTLEQIKSLLSKYGLSHTWKTSQEGNSITVECCLTHLQGHTECTKLTAAPDTTGNKNSIQAIGSTVSYLQRYTLFAILGLASKEMDDDGKDSGGDPVIGPVQVKRLEALLKRCSQKARDNFAKMYGEPKDIKKSEYDDVAARLEGSAARAATGDQS